MHACVAAVATDSRAMATSIEARLRNIPRPMATAVTTTGTSRGGKSGSSSRGTDGSSGASTSNGHDDSAGGATP